MFGPVIEFNVGAWLAHTRDMLPMARSIYMAAVLRLIELGEDGTLPPLDGAGLDAWISLTRCTAAELREHGTEAVSFLQVDEAGQLYSTRARVLAARAEARDGVPATRSASSLRRLEKDPKRPYRTTDYSADPEFQRFWVMMPGVMQQNKRVTWRVWCRFVSPHGQEFIERVLEKFAMYLATERVVGGNFTLPETWLNMRGWEVDFSFLDEA